MNIKRRVWLCPKPCSTQLILSLSVGHPNVVAYLLELRAPPGAITDIGLALQIAARNNHAISVEVLLDLGVTPDTDARDFGNAPIRDAA